VEKTVELARATPMVGKIDITPNDDGSVTIRISP
jgi:hypothetical protein